MLVSLESLRKIVQAMELIEQLDKTGVIIDFEHLDVETLETQPLGEIILVADNEPTHPTYRPMLRLDKDLMFPEPEPDEVA